MTLFSQIAMIVFFMALYYAILHGLGPEFVANFTAFMFDDYIAYWDHYLAPNMPGFGHPAVMVILAALVCALVPGFFRITRFIASVIIAIFLVRLGFAMTGAQGAPAPTFDGAILAAFALGWIIFASALGDRTLWMWLRTPRLSE